MSNCGGISRGIYTLPKKTRGQRDQEGVLAIEPGVTLTHTTGRRDLHQGCSGAGTVGDHAIGMTSTAPGADVNRSR